VVAWTPAGSAREVTDGQAKNPPVGSGSAFFRPFHLALGEAWRVLAMSDGVWKYAGWEAVEAAMREETGERLIERLRERARLPGSGRFPDDFTAVLLERRA
jgi:PPM family protein phosphatase